MAYHRRVGFNPARLGSANYPLFIIPCSLLSIPRFPLLCYTAILIQENHMKRLLGLLLCVACTAAQSPRTIGKGTTAVGLSLGGLYTHIADGVDIPLPYPVIEGRYGVSDTLDVHVGTHVLLDAFGNFQLDLGATYLAIPERGDDKTAVALTGKVMTFINPGAPLLLLPEGILTFSTRIKEESFFYGGLDVVMGAKGDSNGASSEVQVIGTPFLGFQLPIRNRLHTSLELGWVAPYINTEDAVVRFPLPGQSEGGAGALSIKLGFSYQVKKN
jgi:hypothetical protein